MKLFNGLILILLFVGHSVSHAVRPCPKTFGNKLQKSKNFLPWEFENKVQVGILVRHDDGTETLALAPQYIGHRGINKLLKFNGKTIEQYLWGGEVEVDSESGRISRINNISGMIKELQDFGYQIDNDPMVVRAFLQRKYPSVLLNGSTKVVYFEKSVDVTRQYFDPNSPNRHDLEGEVKWLLTAIGQIFVFYAANPEKIPQEKTLVTSGPTLSRVKSFVLMLKSYGISDPTFEGTLKFLDRPTTSYSREDWLEIKKGLQVIKEYLEYDRYASPERYSDKVSILN